MQNLFRAIAIGVIISRWLAYSLYEPDPLAASVALLALAVIIGGSEWK